METPETRTVKYSYRAVPTRSQQRWLAGAYGAVLNVLLLAGGHSESLNGPGGRVRRLELAKPAQSAVSTEGATSFVAHKPRRRRTRAKSLARRARLKSQTIV